MSAKNKYSINEEDKNFDDDGKKDQFDYENGYADYRNDGLVW